MGFWSAARGIPSELGASNEVPFLSGKVYVKAMCFEFENRGIRYISEFFVNVIYEGRIAGEYVVDFIVEDKVIVEVKAIREISVVDERQLLNYLRCTDKEVGLLLYPNWV